MRGAGYAMRVILLLALLSSPCQGGRGGEGAGEGGGDGRGRRRGVTKRRLEEVSRSLSPSLRLRGGRERTSGSDAWLAAGDDSRKEGHDDDANTYEKKPSKMAGEEHRLPSHVDMSAKDGFIYDGADVGGANNEVGGGGELETWCYIDITEGEKDENGVSGMQVRPGPRVAGGTWIFCEGLGVEPQLLAMDSVQARWDMISQGARPETEVTPGAPEGAIVEKDKRPSMNDRSQVMGGGYTPTLAAGAGKERRMASDLVKEGRSIQGGRTSVFVDNLPPGTQVSELGKCMGGEISVAFNRILGYAVVTFLSKENAYRALADPPSLRGNKLELRLFHPGGTGTSSACPREDLSEDSQRVGHADGTVIKRVRAVEPVGFAPFGNKIQTRKFAVSVAESVVEEGRLVPSLSTFSDANQKDSKHVAVVHGIPPNAGVDAVLKAFGECGKIVKSEVGSVREGKRQYAVLEFEDEDSLMRCLVKDDLPIQGWSGGNIRIRRRGGEFRGKDDWQDDFLDDEDTETATLQKFNVPGSKM